MLKITRLIMASTAVCLLLTVPLYSQTEDIKSASPTQVSDTDASISEPTSYEVPQHSSESSLLLEAEAEERKGNLLEARTLLHDLLQLEADSQRQTALRQKIEDINIRILFSPIETPDSFTYEVKRGDNLYNLAKHFNTTVELIQRSNGIDGDLIHVGDKLKIMKVKFQVVINCSRNLLFLKEGDEIIKTYRIASGKGDLTRCGSFKIVNKLENPTWFSAGAVVPPDSPENILGSRWMGISEPGYGIHGTTEPETIGKSVTSGCIRMHNKDVEELYSIVPVGTTVVIEE